MDFKFRVMDLLEIFITKSKKSSCFIETLPKLLIEIKNNLGQKKIRYINKSFYLLLKDFQIKFLNLKNIKLKILKNA